MASKRKSTVPCMIPSKSKHVREEIILGSLPELLPTIPEDSILSISGEESGHFSHSSSKSESGSETQKGGTYSCSTCRFESRDLNYFLDHMHNCHLDFRAQPTFYCLNCGVSVVRFEALALHNANAHPKIMEGLVTASLTVNKRDGVTAVEQSLFTASGEDYSESGISLTKTPIAKMMKAKGDMLTNHTPSLYSPPSSDSNKDLPKVMIPLSSIPTYDAAMDTSSFLKTSFGKFPYPTKAELCYLTVVSEFPEEQIKLWFTAQRLKQGISWSPEEIEEARRKMFNTVFQGGAPQKQHTTPRHVNHVVTHHTVTGQPGSKGPNFQMAKVPFGSLKTRSVGVIASQTSMSTNPHVTRVSYSTPIVPPKFPSIVQTTQVLTKNTPPTVEPDKSNGLSLDMAGNSGCAKCNKDFPIKGMSILKQLIKEEDSFAGDKGCPEMKVDPIKINFKRLKMNETNSTSEFAHQEHKSEVAEVSASQPSFSPPWGNKTPQQLHILRQVFSNTRWPSSQQYEDLSLQTGLPKSEVVRWFSDSRYSHKNGQLKWLETYQRSPTESEEGKSHGDAEPDSPKDPQVAKKKLAEQDVNKHLEGEVGLNTGQRVVWQDTYSPLLSLMGSEGGGEPGQAEESAQPGVLQDPWAERAEDHQQPGASQSLIEQQTDANQARYYSHV
uniref:Si:ch211-232b12.5 n=1 Tax=Echeneis naucrates TaxID=173247 RepID=A0A665VT39_ECHNA